MERQTNPDDEWTLLDRIHLRNPYEVYQRADSYMVVGHSPSGQDHRHRITGEAARFLGDKLRRRSVTAAQAAEVLEPMAARFGLAYTYGDKVLRPGRAPGSRGFGAGERREGGAFVRAPHHRMRLNPRPHGI